MFFSFTLLQYDQFCKGGKKQLFNMRQYYVVINLGGNKSVLHDGSIL